MVLTHTHAQMMCDAATHMLISRLIKEIHSKPSTGNTVQL